MDDLEYMIDAKDFMGNSSCECGYLIDLDRKILEVYSFGEVISDKSLKEVRKLSEDEWIETLK